MDMCVYVCYMYQVHTHTHTHTCIHKWVLKRLPDKFVALIAPALLQSLNRPRPW